MRKSKRNFFHRAAVLFAVLAATSSLAQAQQKRAISGPGPAKNLPFSDGILVGKTLYIAGTEGIDDTGNLAPGGIAPETQTALESIGKVLKAAGFEMKDLVSVTVFLADIHDFGEMNKVYKTLVPDPKPTRATVQVAALVGNARVEISAIAVKGK